MHIMQMRAFLFVLIQAFCGTVYAVTTPLGNIEYSIKWTGLSSPGGIWQTQCNLNLFWNSSSVGEDDSISGTGQCTDIPGYCGPLPFQVTVTGSITNNVATLTTSNVSGTQRCTDDVSGWWAEIGAGWGYNYAFDLSSGDIRPTASGFTIYINREPIKHSSFSVSFTQSSISLETKSFGDNETKAEMQQRYLNSRDFYLEHFWEYFNPGEVVIQAAASACVLADRTDFSVGAIWAYFSGNQSNYFANNNASNYGIECYNKMFAMADRYLANYALSYFLSGQGGIVNLDVEWMLNENPVLRRSLHSNIKDRIASGIYKGDYTIEQSGWDGGSYCDWQLTMGTVLVEWESNGNDVVLYINNKYSFDIKEYGGQFRWTAPLYLEAGSLVRSGSASDYFISGRLKKPLSWLDS